MLWEELIQKDNANLYPVDLWLAYFENNKYPDRDFPNFDSVQDYLLYEMNYIENKNDEESVLYRFQWVLMGWIPMEVRRRICDEMNYWAFWHVYINYTHNPRLEELELSSK